LQLVALLAWGLARSESKQYKETTMKGKSLALAALALCFSALSHEICQAQEETPGQVLQIQTNVGSGYNCGRVSTPLYCYGIPVNVGPPSGGNGTFWLDTNPSTGSGFVLFSGVADLGQGTISSATPTRNSAGQITKLAVVFSGLTNDGDNGTYAGTMTLTFSYYYSSGGGGRGGAGGGSRFICTGGSLTITYP
jgi:hypothetical protein